MASSQYALSKMRILANNANKNTVRSTLYTYKWIRCDKSDVRALDRLLYKYYLYMIVPLSHECVTTLLPRRESVNDLCAEARRPVDMSSWPSDSRCRGGEWKGWWVQPRIIVNRGCVYDEGILHMCWFQSIQGYHLLLSVNLKSKGLVITLHNLIPTITRGKKVSVKLNLT